MVSLSMTLSNPDFKVTTFLKSNIWKTSFKVKATISH